MIQRCACCKMQLKKNQCSMTRRRNSSINSVAFSRKWPNQRKPSDSSCKSMKSISASKMWLRKSIRITRGSNDSEELLCRKLCRKWGNSTKFPTKELKEKELVLPVQQIRRQHLEGL